MKVVAAIDDMKAARAAFDTASVGLVPTMGALHAGHAALIASARAQCRRVVVSIFVNPLQFGPDDDFARYPRTPQSDAELLDRLGVDVLFAPAAEHMYPSPMQVVIDPGLVGRYLEGERRAGHFSGVAAAVLKLFHVVEPRRAYFGCKDAQQLAVIRRLVSDLNVPVEIVAVPTVRDRDGLAFSSRNAFLTERERAAAIRLPGALRALADGALAQPRAVASAVDRAQRLLAPLRGDYLAVVDPAEFRPLEQAPSGRQLLAVGAAFAGRIRLIDNLEFEVPQG
ncbi:MAG: pantoate--beta-alanine ligase [Candidatus Eremiobacteraeota bacterium]|nr:pantoate--beta-alanine ligase [Candidatus Eremiobacteraeota bacterium]